MPRLFKFAIFGFLTYAVLTATPAQQAEMVRGGLAIKDAAIEVCQREGSLCFRAFESLRSAISGPMQETAAPWLDDQANRKSATSPKS